jgi:hypothetical protein
MDITNNVSLVNDTPQTGGDADQVILNNDIDDVTSSDYDITSTKDNNITDNDIVKILNGNDHEINLKKFNIADLNKNSVFLKLNNNQKTLVINRILDKLPKSNKINVNKNSNKVNKDSYFYCKNCGYYKKIPPGMFIFSRGSDKKNDSYNHQFLNYKFDQTLPTTKNYNCINDKCNTHNNPSIKKSVFYRKSNTYNIQYICLVCDSYWNTFTEN